MSELIYEASVYSRVVAYRNFKGEENKVTLYFALDPLQLMALVAGFQPKSVKSGNPALNNKPGEITDEQQLKFIRDLATKAAGAPSEDGESWQPFEGFQDTLAGKAFMTKLTSSDGDRKEFSEKVILDPFRAFVSYAEADPGNSPKEIQQFKQMQSQLENVFKVPDKADETLEEKKARLAAELANLDTSDVPQLPPSTESN